MNPAYCDDDMRYILAEEGRYYDDLDIMNEGITAINIDEMNEEDSLWWNRPEWRSSTPIIISHSEPITTDEDDKPPAKKVSSDPCFGDYETPEDAKTRGGENYHINKQKTKRPSPKSERRKLREKRVKDIRTKESRIHKRAVVHDM